MERTVYRAVYSGSNLSHSKFKYIDKWKSKAGKWVYKYSKDASDDLNAVRSNLKSKMAEYRKKAAQKPKKSQSSRKSKNPSGGWHDVGKDRFMSGKQKYEASVRGDDKTRLRTVKDSSGKTTVRREYKDSTGQRSIDKSIAKYNDYAKGNSSKLKRFLMDFNDKYGPKYTHTIEWSGDEKRYVVEYTKNLFGDRPVSADSYTYYTDPKRIKRTNKKRKGKYRAAVSGNKKFHEKNDPLIAHSGIKGMKWGVRRYQNEDGTLTNAGKKRYASNSAKAAKYEAASLKYAANADAERVRAARYSRTQTALYQNPHDENTIKRADSYGRQADRLNERALSYDAMSSEALRKAKRYINENKKLKNTPADKTQVTVVTQSAVDDYVKVLTGELDSQQFNKRYNSAGFRVL